MDSSRTLNFSEEPVPALLLDRCIELNYTADMSLNIGLDMVSDS